MVTSARLRQLIGNEFGQAMRRIRRPSKFDDAALTILTTEWRRPIGPPSN
jgi:hypothetical protein